MATRGFEHVKASDVAKLGRQAQTTKYRNRKTTVDGMTFDSAKEARRWLELLAMGKAGMIRNLARQLGFSLKVNGILVGTYSPDFVYEERIDDEWVKRVEDVKSSATRTEAYRLRRRVFEACYGISIRET